MTTPKLHHFLPQTIQKEFSKDRKTIFRYDKSKKVWEKVGIKGNAAISHHNTVYDEAGNKNTTLETALAEIDGKYISLLRHIEQKKPLQEMKNYIESLLAFSYSRSPKQRKNMTRIANELLTHFQNFGMQDDSNPNRIKNQTILGSLAETDVYGMVMHNSYFWVAEANGANKFFTSDNPCGSSSMPLAPNFTIASSSETRNPEYVIVPEKIVQMFNQLVFKNAEQYIYAGEEIQMTEYEEDKHILRV